MECFWFSERGNQVPKDFPFMGSKRYCVNCILPAIPYVNGNNCLSFHDSCSGAFCRVFHII